MISFVIRLQRTADAVHLNNNNNNNNNKNNNNNEREIHDPCEKGETKKARDRRGEGVERFIIIIITKIGSFLLFVFIKNEFLFFFLAPPSSLYFFIRFQRKVGGGNYR